MAKKRILFTGGGSGGHVMPVLAVMAALQADPRSAGVECWYAGLASDVDSDAVRTSPLHFEKAVIRSGKLNRFMTWRHLGQAASFAVGTLQAMRLIGRIKPDAVFAKGGFVGVPVVLAAARKGIPIFCHESDAVLGLANRIVARYAKRVFTAYPEATYAGLPAAKLRHVGQPVRAEFYLPAGSGDLVLAGQHVSFDLPVITVIGGSQGARRLNELIQEGWEGLLANARLVHICGQEKYEALARRAERLAPEVRARLHLVPFVLDGLAELFKRSAVVVSRAGGTVAELAAAKAAAVLVPLPSAAQDHQAANAKLLADAGAAIVVDERTATAVELKEAVLGLVADQDRRNRLAESIARFARPEAAAAMATELLDVLS